MSLPALGLLLAAATLHTGWNLLLKRAGEKYIFTWWALVVGALGFAPVLMLSAPLPVRVWPYIVSSAIVEAIYFVALAQAYQRGDFSLVYPLARGAAPALLALWAALFLGESLRPSGLAGLGLLLAGLLIVGGTTWWERRGGASVGSEGIGAAFVVACCISIYSVIDGTAMRFAAAVPYTVWITGLTAVFLSPVVLGRYGRYAVMAEWRLNWPRIGLVGVATMLTYMLVLQAYSMARVSYVGAVREVSIVLAALVGWRWLGERFGARRLAGAICIFVGILFIAAAG